MCARARARACVCVCVCERESVCVCMCVCVCDLETSTMRWPGPELGRCSTLGGVGGGGEQEKTKQYDFTLQTTRRHIPRSSRRIFMLNQKSHKRNSESSELLVLKSS
jgi:hypothetical protein